MQSRQRDVPADVISFYSAFIAQWLLTADFEALAADFGVDQSQGRKRSARRTRGDHSELAGRLRAWRLRDHGRVAEIAHSARPLTVSQRTTLADI